MNPAWLAHLPFYLAMALPLASAALIVILHQYRPEFRGLWPIGAMTAVLVWILVFLMRPEGYLEVPLLPWQAEIAFLESLVGAMRFGAYMIAIANDDSLSKAVLVRANSPILKAKGVNKDFPETYGSAETVKGKTVLVTTVSSGHYALSTWLKRIGLKDTDVVIQNMDQGQALAAFESGVGDIAVLWAPSMFIGMSKGWKMVNTDSQKGANMTNVIVADKAWADKNPEQVAKYFSKCIFEGSTA